MKIIQDFVNQMYRDNAAALAFVQDAKNLTEDQKFVICLAAGVAINTDYKDGKLVMTTRYPCAVERINGKWQVFTNENL